MINTKKRLGRKPTINVTHTNLYVLLVDGVVRYVVTNRRLMYAYIEDARQHNKGYGNRYILYSYEPDIFGGWNKLSTEYEVI